MTEKILEFLKDESNSYKDKNNGIFTSRFYDEIDINDLKNRIKIIQGAFKREYSDELFLKHFEAAINHHKSTNRVTIQESSVLKINAKKWLDEQRYNKIGWNHEQITTYRERYFAYLKKIGRNEKVTIEKGPETKTLKYKTRTWPSPKT